MREFSIYIHIPFCEKKCNYCDFISFKKDEELIKTYMKALEREIKSYKDLLKNYKVETVFIGGGTPSLLSEKQLESLMSQLYKNFNMEDVKEITIEANPGTLNLDKIRSFEESTINRISLGAQSFDDELLRYIGRTHNSRDIYKGVELIKNSKISSINLDLIFGLPYQSYNMALESIKEAIKLDVDHISHYGLILEGGTPMHKEYLNGNIELMNDELDRRIYHSTRKLLLDNNYRHYEISNFAKENHESKHNLVYWNIKPYIGLGIGSHSNFEGKRFSNTTDLKKYLKSKDNIIENIEEISKEEEIVEYTIMGFRKIKGISLLEFKKRFKENFEEIYEKEIKKNLKYGLIENINGYLRLTERGLDLSNQVELDFFK